MDNTLLRVARQSEDSHLDSSQPYDLAEFNSTEFSPPFMTKDGPHPLISDSLFSLIIFIYVSVTFLYIFYAFCWRTEVHKPMPDNRDLPMITEMLDAVDQKDIEKKEEV